MGWINENAGLLLPLVAVLFTGVGFLIKRWLTGERHREQADSLEKAVQLKRLLDAEGMTLEDAVSLRDRLRGNVGALMQAQAREVLARQRDENPMEESASFSMDPVPFEETTVGMGAKVSSELAELEGQLEYVLADLAHQCSENRGEALRMAQTAWESYRDREAEFTAMQWEGGTGAPLLGAARKVELTEKRLAELRLARAEIDRE